MTIFPDIPESKHKRQRLNDAFAAHELEQLHECLSRTTVDERIFMAGEMILAFPDQLEAQRIREGVYGDRIPQALLNDPPPLVKEALIQVGRLPPE